MKTSRVSSQSRTMEDSHSDPVARGTEKWGKRSRVGVHGMRPYLDSRFHGNDGNCHRNGTEDRVATGENSGFMLPQE